MFKYAKVILAMFSITAMPLFSDAALGEKLETQMWENMKHRNFRDIEDSIAQEFQSVHSFGAFNRDEEINLIKNLYLGTYEISNLKVTENADTLVVTYLISVKEKIDSINLNAKPAPRLSVWKKFDNKWKWISHANLKEIPADQPKATLSKEPVKKAQ